MVNINSVLKFFKKRNSTSNRYSEDTSRNWFIKNKIEIEKFIDSATRDFSIYNQLKKEIKKYNPLLFPEITKINNEQYVLIITLYGIEEGVKPTQELVFIWKDEKHSISFLGNYHQEPMHWSWNGRLNLRMNSLTTGKRHRYLNL